MSGAPGSVAVLAVAAFLIGSIPFGVVVSRMFFGSDIRSSGSGNIGAANALRTYGKAGGGAVLLLDLLKGLAAASIGLAFDRNTSSAYLGTSIATVAAVAGHCYSPWLRLRGGKGVATYLGALFALTAIGDLGARLAPWPLCAIVFILVWLTVVIPTRLASLGSLTATATTTFTMYLVTHNLTASGAAFAVTVLIFYKHRENIARLRAGTERKITAGRASRAA